MNITNNSVPQKSPKIVSRVVDDETVIVDPPKGIVTIINNTGSRIWELIDNKRTAGEIASVIKTEYDVSEECAWTDLQEFLADMIQKDLILLS